MELVDVLLCVCGLCFFVSVYHLTLYIVRRIHHRVHSGSKTLLTQQNSKATQIDSGNLYVLAERVVSAVQAVCACVVGLIVIKQCRGEDLLREQHWLVNSYAYFAVPYFYFDVYAMFNTFRHTNAGACVQRAGVYQSVRAFCGKEPLMMFHHILLPLIMFPVVVWLRNGRGDFFLGCFFMFELVIPFISVRAVLKQFGQEETWLYRLNGLALLVVFGACRVGIFPYMYWEYGRSTGVGLTEVPGRIPLKCNAGCAVLLVIQLYWFFLIARIIFRKALGLFIKQPTHNIPRVEVRLRAKQAYTNILESKNQPEPTQTQRASPLGSRWWSALVRLLLRPSPPGPAYTSLLRSKACLTKRTHWWNAGNNNNTEDCVQNGGVLRKRTQDARDISLGGDCSLGAFEEEEDNISLKFVDSTEGDCSLGAFDEVEDDISLKFVDSTEGDCSQGEFEEVEDDISLKFVDSKETFLETDEDISLKFRGSKATSLENGQYQ